TFEGSLSWVSGSSRQILGYEPEEMMGRPAWDFIHPDDLDSAADRLAGAVDNIEMVDPIALRARHADGSWIAVEVAAALMKDETGTGTELIISIRDVQWRQDALAAVRDSEQL